jgi:ABC-type transport system involved in cytochrome bd biosynthesis fused ATPase/permease subunit
MMLKMNKTPEDKRAFDRMLAEASRQAAEDRRTQAELAVRQQINNEDNQTALEIANLEVASGENIAVSTGTGINP